MAVSQLRWRPMAVALIVQDDDGAMHIMGSKSVFRATIEGRADSHPLDWNTRLAGLQSFRIEAECADMTWQYRAHAAPAPQIEQRGIYLPDMSFRALPDGEQ